MTVENQRKSLQLVRKMRVDVANIKKYIARLQYIKAQEEVKVIDWTSRLEETEGILKKTQATLKEANATLKKAEAATLKSE